MLACNCIKSWAEQAAADTGSRQCSSANVFRAGRKRLLLIRVRVDNNSRLLNSRDTTISASVEESVDGMTIMRKFLVRDDAMNVVQSQLYSKRFWIKKDQNSYFRVNYTAKRQMTRLKDTKDQVYNLFWKDEQVRNLKVVQKGILKTCPVGCPMHRPDNRSNKGRTSLSGRLSDAPTGHWIEHRFSLSVRSVVRSNRPDNGSDTGVFSS